MKNILGLDLGVGSIGWCLINKSDNNEITIKKIGVRKIPLTNDEAENFTKGNALSKNAQRTQKRTARKCYDRYQLRRKNLTTLLRQYNMLPNEQLVKLGQLELWTLRANAANGDIRLSPAELGRVLYHLNQKRGYKHNRLDTFDAKQTAYVKEVNERYKMIQEKNLTIGQYFLEKIKENEYMSETGNTYYTYRIKDQVFPREAYEEEFWTIMNAQKVHHPTLLTDQIIEYFYNAIYFQRELKSCKHLISLCNFERKTLKKDGREINYGPKVAPKSSPLAQLCKIWESVNNIKIKNRKNDELFITLEQKRDLVNFLTHTDKLNSTSLYSQLHISKKDGWWAGKAIGAGLQGDTTRIQLEQALSSLSSSEQKNYLRFDLKYIDEIDSETGEIRTIIDPSFIDEPLYKLWHLVYSIKDKKELENALRKFGIQDQEALDKLLRINFVKEGYSNKSVKFIRRILPALQEGFMYNEACEKAGYRHSDYLTKEENLTRELKKVLPSIQKNELRQPVVEKVLNQLINIINAVLRDLKRDCGKDNAIDEIRIELARELRQNKEQRNEAYIKNKKSQKENENIAKRIKEEYNLDPTRNRIQRYKMWEETQHLCIYCGQPVQAKSFLTGIDEREHIIPKSLLFDNSFSNLTCSCRKCNMEKNNRTAFDYIKETRKETEVENYIQRVNTLYKDKHISYTKLQHLLASYDDYTRRKVEGKETDDDKNLWEDFIERHLRQSQYIATKAVEILSSVCRYVYVTSGSVTDYMRHVWGYDEILHTLNFERYKSGGHTSIITRDIKGQTTTVERITNWTKRMDDRHHAIDALTIACTTQAMVQRLNSLSANREDIREEVKNNERAANKKEELLEKWAGIQPHPRIHEAKDAIAAILISLKPGLRISTPGKRYIYKKGKRILAQKGILVPRVPLHDEFVYGQITCDEKKRIVKKCKLAIGSMNCLFNGKETYKEEKVINNKTGIEEIKITDDIKDALVKIVDKGIRERILERLNRGFEEGKDYRSNPKKALENLKELENDPIYSDDAHTMPIRTVRRFYNSSTAIPIRYNAKDEPIAFVEPGGNHHVALYKDKNGKIIESLITRWQAIERVRYGIPAIITSPSETWSEIEDRDDIPQNILEDIPDVDWIFIQSMQINDSFILDMDEDEYAHALETNDKKTLAEHLYFIQNLSSKAYRLRRHTEPKFDTLNMNKKDCRFYNIKSIDAFLKLNPHSVKIDLLGELITHD